MMEQPMDDRVKGSMKDKSEIRGMITKGVGGLYTVRPDLPAATEIVCKARGVFRHENITPLVGDRVVLINEAGDEADGYIIDEILPRRNSLIRPALANLTHLFIVVPAAKPAPDLLTVDKLISIADARDIEPVIIVNKNDIAPDEGERIRKIYSASGFSCFLLSAESGEGCGDLYDYFIERCAEGTVISAFAGASAAGKSTLLTHLFPSLELKTGTVSRKTQRGRHTTRHAELYAPIAGKNFFVADTPGFSLLDFTRFNFYELSELPWAFREFRDLIGKCRYTKCTHLKEEGCAVLEKVRSGEIPKERHDSYVALYEEIKKKPEWKRRAENGGK